MAPSIEEDVDGETQERAESPAGDELAKADQGPDPVIGAGITLFGIFLMGTGGARDAHYLFNVGTGTAVLGAATFVLSVAISAMKQRRASS